MRYFLSFFNTKPNKKDFSFFQIASLAPRSGTNYLSYLLQLHPLIKEPIADDFPHEQYQFSHLDLLNAYIENSIFANNLQAKMILGDTYNYYYNKMVNGYDIKQELLHILINKKIVIGLSEEFDLSILYFKYHFKWKTRGVLDYKTQNKTPYRPHVNSLNNNIIQKIENRNKLDILLYESGKIIFDKQIKKFPLWKRKFLKISDKYLFLNHIIDFFQKYF